MSNELARYADFLKAEITTKENSADEIADLARFLKQSGQDGLAATLFAVVRQFRIKALDLRGRLAALNRFSRYDELP